VSITDRVAVEDVCGRAVVLHAGPDNLGNVPVGPGPAQYTPNSPEATAATARTGNSGDRLACGVIQAR
jgi:Cu-Zn family superoxide dismutase